MITLYVNTDASSNGDGSAGSPYNSLSNALIAGNSPVTRGDNVTINIYGSTATSAATTIAPSYTDATHQLYIVGNRTLPYWSTAAHRFTINNANCFTLGGYVHLDKLQIHVTSGGFANIAVYIDAGGSTWLSNSILRGQGSLNGQSYHSGLEANYNGTSSVYAWDNIVYDFIGYGDSCGLWNHQNAYAYFDNNTIYNCTQGISLAQASNSERCTVRNNIVSGCTSYNFFNNSLLFNQNSSHNTSTDGTGPNTSTPDSTNLVNQTVNFENTTNRDFRLTSSNSSVLDNAQSLSSDFSTDIVGTSRPQGAAWDRGAYELLSNKISISQKKQNCNILGTSQQTDNIIINIQSNQKKQIVSIQGASVVSYNVVGSLVVQQKKQSTTVTGTSQQTYKIIDHTYITKYINIPQYYINIIKTKRFNLPGESHSSGYRNGLQWLNTQEPKLSINRTESGTPESYNNSHLRVDRATWGDLNNSSGWIYGYGEEDWYTSTTAISRTKAHLQYCYDNSLVADYFGFGWCWDMTWSNDPGGTVDPIYKCRWAGSSVGGPEGNLIWGLDSGDQALTGNSICMDTYLSITKDYIDYCNTNNIPTKVFYTTGPVDSYSGENAYQREIKHQYIRDYIISHGGYLFDYADILCWDNSGNQNTSQWTDGESTVHTFPQIASDNLLNFDGSDGSDGTGHIGERGELRLAKATWVMLAMMEGWDGVTTENVSVNLNVSQKKQSTSINVFIPNTNSTLSIASKKQSVFINAGNQQVIHGYITISQKKQSNLLYGVTTNVNVIISSTQKKQSTSLNGEAQILGSYASIKQKKQSASLYGASQQVVYTTIATSQKKQSSSLNGDTTRVNIHLNINQKKQSTYSQIQSTEVNTIISVSQKKQSTNIILSHSTSYGGILKRYNGISWTKSKLKVYNNEIFNNKLLKVYNGSSWLLINTSGE